jgi:hypothetical protein
MNTDFGRNSLNFRGPIVWNSLDKKTHDVDNIEHFKIALKSNSISNDTDFLHKRNNYMNNNDLENFVFY